MAPRGKFVALIPLAVGVGFSVAQIAAVFFSGLSHGPEATETVEFLAEEMFDLFRADQRLQEIEADSSPFPVKTEREKAVEDKNLPVYRSIFQKTPAKR